MRRSKPVPIGDIWQEFLRNAPTVARKIAEAKALHVWEEVAGAGVASFTTSKRLVGGVLYVQVSSSVVRHEVFMHRELLRERINARVGLDVVRTLIVK